VRASFVSLPSCVFNSGEVLGLVFNEATSRRTALCTANVSIRPQTQTSQQGYRGEAC
jgi:hypothetical protein